MYSATNNSAVYVKIGSGSRGRGNDDDCCDPPRTTRIRSRSSATYKQRQVASYEKDTVQRYCDSIPPGCDPNPRMIGDIIRDLHCVYEKMFGQRRDIETRYRSVQSDIEELRKQLADCECCKAEMQDEICRLQAELRAAQCAFEEEAQRRLGLETRVTQLKAQLNRLQAMLDADNQGKSRLLNSIRELEMKAKQMAEAIRCLQAERDQLLKNCKGFEEHKVRQVETISVSQGRCDQLEEALAKCCKANEDLQRELTELKREIDALKAYIEQLKNEKRRMAEEFERERLAWKQERSRLEQLIADLKKAMDCLTTQNQATCQKMNEVVTAHHAELDCLYKEAEKFRALYECEKGQREKLERALQDCEERKREMLAQQQQQQFQMQQQQIRQQQFQQQSTTSIYRDPCADILRRFSSDC